MIKLPKELPKWFANSAPNANFSLKEVTLLFGFRSDTSVRKGLPKPDISYQKCPTIGRKGQKRWSKQLLLEIWEVRQRR